MTNNSSLVKLSSSPSFAKKPCGLPQGGMAFLASEGSAKMPRGLPWGASLRIGTLPYGSQPEYKLALRLRELGLRVKDLDHTRPGCLEDLDVMIIEQNGSVDYMLVYEEAIHEFVRSGGICWILHQHHERWVPHWLPDELAQAILLPRYYETKPKRWEYLMPDIHGSGHLLFHVPCRIEPEDMVYWDIKASVDTHSKREPELIHSAALSCIIHSSGWETLGGYRDSAVVDGALLIEARYGKGLFFWTQLLFPEIRPPDGDRGLAFWDKFVRNALFRFETAKEKGAGPLVKSSPSVSKRLPVKRNYRLITHVHSLDCPEAGSSPATINAAMRYMGMDIAVMSVNWPFAFGRPVLDNLEQYNDNRVLLIPGEEFHPFNYETPTAVHNRLHILNMGSDAYTRKFHGGLFNMTEIDRYVKETLKYIRSHNGVSCATHVTDAYWTQYDFEAVDLAERMLRGLSGTELESFYLAGKRITAMICMDMAGIQCLREYPVFNFVCLDGAPAKDSVLSAIRKGRLMPALRMEMAHVALGSYLPGDSVPIAKARSMKLKVSFQSQTPVDTVTVFSADRIIFSEKVRGASYENEITMKDADLRSFIRLEAIGSDCTLLTNPFYLFF